MRKRLLLALAILAGLFAGYQWATWPDVARLAEADPETSTFIERQRRQVGRPVGHSWVPYPAISDDLKLAVLVAEDIGFFDHRGFAVDEMRIALRQTVAEGRRLRGASTITQQLAKNLWLSPSRSPWRKAEEAILTWQLERRLEKRRILELYLNVVELGPGVYGAEAAARRYFRKPAGALGEAEAAELAASLPRPASWPMRGGASAPSTSRARPSRRRCIAASCCQRGRPSRGLPSSTRVARPR